MRWTYDASVGALYIDVRPGEIESQVEMADGVIVDITSTVSIVGLEVLDPERPWNLDAVAERFGLSAEERDTIKFHRRVPADACSLRDPDRTCHDGRHPRRRHIGPNGPNGPNSARLGVKAN
jgi:uncharacterized protein YuzE